jgi:hypothetical protein
MRSCRRPRPGADYAVSVKRTGSERLRQWKRVKGAWSNRREARPTVFNERRRVHFQQNRVQSGLEISSHCRALLRSVENPWSPPKRPCKSLNLRVAPYSPSRAGRTFVARRCAVGPSRPCRLAAFESVIGGFAAARSLVSAGQFMAQTRHWLPLDQGARRNTIKHDRSIMDYDRRVPSFGKLSTPGDRTAFRRPSPHNRQNTNATATINTTPAAIIRISRAS